MTMFGDIELSTLTGKYRCIYDFLFEFLTYHLSRRHRLEIKRPVWDARMHVGLKLALSAHSEIKICRFYSYNP